MLLGVVFENILIFLDVKHWFFLSCDGLGQVKDSLMIILITLDKKDPLLAEQIVLCPVAVFVDND